MPTLPERQWDTFRRSMSEHRYDDAYRELLFLDFVLDPREVGAWAGRYPEGLDALWIRGALETLEEGADPAFLHRALRRFGPLPEADPEGLTDLPSL